MFLIQQANVNPVGDPACWQRQNPHLVFLGVTLQTEQRRCRQFTQHKPLLHSRTAHNSHAHRAVTSCHGRYVYLLLNFCILLRLFVVLFCVCTCSRPFFFFCFPPIPPTTFLTCFGSSATPCFLPTSFLVAKCLFSAIKLLWPSCFSVCQIGPFCLGCILIAVSLVSFPPSLSIRKRISIPTALSGATPSAP